ncbi:MAG: hypothetical protein H8Z69_01565 [Nanohaloarchaea archaeon]|nr:hypothetical protein [Candidatus Nanohaloarchaea archaeon]
MVSEKEIKSIRKMASDGKSVNKIKQELKIPKSTVYYHFRKEVGQKQKENQPEIPECEEFKGELCGIFAGDGNFYHEKANHKYRITITLNINDNYWEEVQELLTEKLNKEPLTLKQKEFNRLRLRYESKVIYKFFSKHLDWDKKDKTASIHLKQNEISKEFKKGFLRGLIDTDGHLDLNQKRLIFNTISKPLAETTENLLSDFNLEHNTYRFIDKRENCRDMYRTYITGDEVEEFLTKIKPRHPKKQLKKLFDGKVP